MDSTEYMDNNTITIEPTAGDTSRKIPFLYAVVALALWIGLSTFFRFRSFYPLLLNVPVAFFIEYETRNSENMKLYTPSALFSVAVLAIELAVLELLASGALNTLLLVSQPLDGLFDVMVMAAVYCAAWPLARRVPFLRTAPGDVFPRDFAAAGGVVTLALMLLDIRFAFRFMLLVNTSMLICFFSYYLAVYRLRYHVENRFSAKHHLLFWAVVALLVSGLVFTVQHLSMLGCYKLFGKGVGYELRESRRAEINSAGFRGPEIPVAAPPGTIRIAVMGDSTTYGFLLPESSSYSRALEAELNGAAAEGVSFEVINGGVPAYDLSHVEFRLRHRMMKYKPDVVLVMSGPNDRGFLEGDQLEKHLRDIVSVARGGGSRIVLVSYPFITKSKINIRHVERMKTFAKRERIPFVDLFHPMLKTEGCFFMDTHPKARGHAMIADILFRELIKNKLISCDMLMRGACN